MRSLIISALLLGSVAVSQHAAAADANDVVATVSRRGTDPRCSAANMAGKNAFVYEDQCPSLWYELGRAYTASLADSSSCGKLDACAQCLTGDAWAQTLTEMGLGTAPHGDVRPWVLFRGWLSSEVTSTIAMILLREVLGYDAFGRIGRNTGNLDFICCGEDEIMIDFERWGEGGASVRGDEDGYFTVQMIPTGYSGTGAFYMPTYTLEKFPMADSYNAYKYLPEYAEIFPKAFSTPCYDMLRYKDNATHRAWCDTNGGDLSAHPEYFWCGANTWTNTSCVDGRYVPPQCQGDNGQYCQEIYHTTPTADRGRFEGIIKNNNLNFTLAYVGEGYYPGFLKAKFANKTDFLFYWQVPDPLTTALTGRPINLEPNTAACEAIRNADPTLNMAGCGYPVTTIQKAARRDVLRANPDLKHFVDSFSLSDDLIGKLLVQHTLGTGTKNVHQISCDWIKSNAEVWTKWVQHTPVDPGRMMGGSTAADSVAAWIIVVPIVIVLVLALALIGAFIFTRRRVDNTLAPKEAPLALLFTDVERSTTLWELCGEDMRQAMDVHNRVIRELIAEYQAYEVKTNGDSFMIACRSLTDATLLALAIQTALNDAVVPPSIAHTYAQILGNTAADKTVSAKQLKRSRASSRSSALGGGGSAGKYAANNVTGSLVGLSTANCWSGIRVRIALHWGTELTPKVDPITGRYDYFGHDVNVCARVESYARGGQVLVDEGTHLAMTRNADLMDLVEPDATMTCVAKRAELKGVQEKFQLWSICPKVLSARAFGPIPGTGCDDGASEHDEKRYSQIDSTSQESNAGGLESNAAGDTNAAIRFAFQFVMGGFSEEPDRRKWLVALASKYKAPTHYNNGRLAKVLQSTAMQQFNGAGASNHLAAGAGGAATIGGSRVKSHTGSSVGHGRDVANSVADGDVVIFDKVTPYNA